MSKRGPKLKTHCPRGHPYSGDNLRIYGNKKVCVICNKEQSRRKRRRDGAKPRTDFWEQNPEARALAAKLWLEGKTGREVAKEINTEYRLRVTPSAVIGLMRRIGLTEAERPTTPAQDRGADLNRGNKRGAVSSAIANVLVEGGRRDAVPIAVRRRSRKKKPFFPEPVQRPGPAPSTFSSCQFPEGDEVPFVFCGAPTWVGTSYCRRHYKDCHVKRAA